MQVLIIGCGAAGLAALRHFAGRHGFQTVAYEQGDAVGGTWVYTDETERDSDREGTPVHSSMYQNLRTNIPREVMGFPDYPFVCPRDCFPHHTKVLEYLRSYADHFRLGGYIKDDGTHHPRYPRWMVTSRDTVSEEDVDEVFDAVLICSGHYSTPYWPELPGLRTFPGTLLHSHDYRHPEPFEGQVVLCLGGGYSGVDITMELSHSAKKVYLSQREPFNASPFPENVENIREVVRVEGEQLLTADDRRVRVDAFILCTGYLVNLSFLSPECGLRVTGKNVFPLFRHVVNAENCSMAVIGINSQAVPFPLFHYQVLYFLFVLEHPELLPSKEEMLVAIEDDRLMRRCLSFPEEDREHRLGKLQWAYKDELADICGTTRVPEVVRAIDEYTHKQRNCRVMDYKQEIFIIESPSTFSIHCALDGPPPADVDAPVALMPQRQGDGGE